MHEIQVISPAKVNLFLEISHVRADGYHDAYSIMHTLGLHDDVYVRMFDEPNKGGAYIGDGLPTLDACVYVENGVESLAIERDENSAFVAASSFLQAFKHKFADVPHIQIDIQKRIPHQAGLGGGSSNAAATLIALCKLVDIDVQDEAVVAIAKNIGADVAFFLYGGCVALGGRGDVFERRLDAIDAPIVLVKPQSGVSTVAAYKAFDEGLYEIALDVSHRAHTCASASQVVLGNNLAPAAETLLQELRDVRVWLASQPGVMPDGVLLSGSGSTTFALCENAQAAQEVAQRAMARGWWAHATSLQA